MPKPTRVLVADDEPSIRQMFSDVLSPTCRVTLASDGEEAKALLLKERPDIAVLDIYMPRLDGLSLTQWARESYPTMAIITMTGYDSHTAMVNSVRAGADNYLVKPFGAVQIRELVEEGRLRARMREEIARREEEFKRSKEFAERLLDEAGAAILALDRSGKAILCNKAAVQLSGYPKERILEQGWEVLVYPDETQRDAARRPFLESSGQFETEITTIRGDSRAILWSVTRITGERGGKAGLIAVGIDVTNQRLMQKQLEKQATTDPLTQLYNRLFFEEVLAREMSRSTRYGIPLGLMMIDVDHLKEVNDRFGHDAGDRLIRAAADLLKESVRKPDIVARYGGDEFVVLLPHTDEAGAQRIADRIRDACSGRSLSFGGHTIPLSFSVGIATGKGDECSRLLKTADTNMYEVKRAKPGRAARR